MYSKNQPHNLEKKNHCIEISSYYVLFVCVCVHSNPTGAVATKEQLEETIRICKERGSILVFDAAYAPFIRTPGVPKSIYECEGAKDVAIEVNSFSKYAGFTGVRLGWTIVPKALKFSDGTPVWNDFNRVMGTAFNGASNIVQEGGMACLDDAGLDEINVLIEYYLENANLLRETFMSMDGFDVYGGIDAPYVFVKLPESLGGSWDAFQTILEQTQVVTIPGAGFGPSGEGFLRLSSFAPRDGIIEACRRIKEVFG
jgi:LL-diaminopimelate aminotransferase